MKGSVLKKFLCTCLVTAAAFAATTISASACTTIYVGGDLVEEGTPFVARTEDYGSDYNKLWFHQRERQVEAGRPLRRLPGIRTVRVGFHPRQLPFHLFYERYLL